MVFRIVLVLVGSIAYFALPVAQYPEIAPPNIVVRAAYPGANAETIASLVTAPLERQFGQIPALSTMTSSSSYGISQITLQFDLNRDIDSATVDAATPYSSSSSQPITHANTSPSVTYGV